MYKSDPPQFCHYNCIFANNLYLILLSARYDTVTVSIQSDNRGRGV